MSSGFTSGPSVGVPARFPEIMRDDVFRLETRRLWLRWPRRADIDGLVKQASDRAVAEMTASIPHPLPRAATEQFVDQSRDMNEAGFWLALVVTPKGEPNAPIGTMSLKPAAGGLGDAVELGYWLGVPSWGFGYATEAARAVIDAFFAYTDGRELGATTRVTNAASRRVLEKCGFAPSGSGFDRSPARGGASLPIDRFRLDRRKWASLKAWSSAGYVPAHRATPQMESAVAL